MFFIIYIIKIFIKKNIINEKEVDIQMDYKHIKHLTKIEKPDIECFKCGKKGVLYEDPNIEELYFCEECWEERFKTELLDRYGYDNELPYDE